MQSSRNHKESRHAFAVVLLVDVGSAKPEPGLNDTFSSKKLEMENGALTQELVSTLSKVAYKRPPQSD